MNVDRSLRGGCSCGRNRYVVHMPQDANSIARVLFDSHPSHRFANASPLSAFLRVPLDWYHSTTFAFFPDETSSMIRRAYTAPFEEYTRRQFCGFCGTPLTFWSESPRSEADFIQLTLGSLSNEDLADLEDLGLLRASDDEEVEESEAAPNPSNLAIHSRDESAQLGGEMIRSQGGRDVVGDLPWFDTLVSGSRLGNMRRTKGTGTSQDGWMRYEWEVVEWTESDGEEPRNGKRKLDQRDDPADSTMKGVEQ